MTKHIQNIDEQEWTAIKWFIRGFIAGIKDSHSNSIEMLDDYWHAWDNTLDLNFLVDGQEVKCFAYSVKPDGYTDSSNYEQVFFNDTLEFLA